MIGKEELKIDLWEENNKKINLRGQNTGARRDRRMNKRKRRVYKEEKKENVLENGLMGFILTKLVNIFSIKITRVLSYFQFFSNEIRRKFK